MALRYSTERLEVYDFEFGDEAFLLELVNSPNWQKYIGQLGPRTEQTATEYIQMRLLDSYTQNGFGLFKVVLKANAKPIGMCGLVQRDYLDYPDLGFAILPEFERRGFTHEAAKGCLEFAKTKLQLEQILAITDKKNIPSQSLLLKLGFRYEGQRTFSGEPSELSMYSFDSQR